MDQTDIFDYIVDKVDALSDYDLGALADYSLPTDWFYKPSGQSRDSVVDQVSIVIYSKYFDSGAADDWGPNTYADWYIGGVLSRPKVPNQDLDTVVH